MDQNYILDTLKASAGRDSALETLMDFERVIDNTNVYAYKNWIEGQIVEGPHIEKYWVTVTLMYRESSMPDPEGAERLSRIGAKVYFAKDELVSAAKLKTPDDRDTPDDADGKRPGQPRAKKVVTPIWLVTIELPRKHLEGVADATLRVDDQNIDSTAVEQATADGLGDDDVINPE
jgi:hypothetical protein